MNAKHSKRRSVQVIKMSSTTFHRSSSVKNMKSTADAGKRHNSFRMRVRCNAQFSTIWVLAQDASSSISTSNSDKRFDIPNSCLWWNLTCGSMTLWCTLLTQNEFTTESTLSSVPTASPLPWRLILLPVFLNFFNNLFRPETVQPLPENYVISFAP